MGDYYLQDTTVLPVLNSNIINVVNSNIINVVDTSNLNCYNLTTYNDGSINGNLNCLQNIICSSTIFCTSLNTQNYYVGNVISSSNIYAKNVQITGNLVHPRGSSNVVIEVIDSNGFIDITNIKNFAPSNLSATSFINQLGEFANAGASLANAGVNGASAFEKFFSGGASDAANLGEGAVKSLTDGLQDGSADDQSKYSPSNSINVSFLNITKKPFYCDSTNMAIEQNIVLSDTSSIVYDQPLGFNTNTNNNVTYKANTPNKILDVSGSVLYINNFSNVKTIDLSNIQIRSDGSIRRSINNSNIIGIDGISFSNFTISNAQNITASNLQCKILTNTLSNNLAISSGSCNLSLSSSLLTIQSSNNNIISACNTSITSPNVSITGCNLFINNILYSSNNTISGISNLSSEYLTTPRCYTGTDSNLYVMGEIKSASLYAQNNNIQLQKNLVSSCNFSNNSMYTSNGMLFCDTLIVNKIAKAPILSMAENIPITSNYTPGVYTSSKLTINALDSTVIFYDSLNSQKLQSGTISANVPLNDARWQMSYNTNPFNY